MKKKRGLLEKKNQEVHSQRSGKSTPDGNVGRKWSSGSERQKQKRKKEPRELTHLHQVTGFIKRPRKERNEQRELRSNENPGTQRRSRYTNEGRGRKEEGGWEAGREKKPRFHLIVAPCRAAGPGNSIESKRKGVRGKRPAM